MFFKLTNNYLSAPPKFNGNNPFFCFFIPDSSEKNLKKRCGKGVLTQAGHLFIFSNKNLAAFQYDTFLLLQLF